MFFLLQFPFEGFIQDAGQEGIEFLLRLGLQPPQLIRLRLDGIKMRHDAPLFIVLSSRLRYYLR